MRGYPPDMASQRWGWIRHIAVLGGFELIFAGVAAVGIFLTAAAFGVIDGAVAVAAAAVVLIAVGMLLLRASSKKGGLLDARRTKARRMIYRDQYRGRPTG